MCITSPPRSMHRCATTNLQCNVQPPRIWQLSNELRPPTNTKKSCPFNFFPTQARREGKVISVGVTAYNEEAREVHRTLQGLNECLTMDLRKRGFRLCVFLVFDGMEHMHHSCETLIASLVGTPIPKQKDTHHDMDACTYFAVASSRQAKLDYPNLNMSVMVKQDNRGKANSLEWYLQSFCSAYQPIYAVTTDTGTYFKHRALEVVDDTFIARPEISALMNRFEIMSAADQGMDDTLFQSSLRFGAMYENEASMIQNDVYSIIGHIPTLPGYTSVYKYGEICGQALDNFFAVQNTQNTASAVSECKGQMYALKSLICENRKLTEDVNIALEANFNSNSRAGSTTVQAIGHESNTVWDPEVTVEKLVQQRRRWKNGGYAGKLPYFWSGAWRMNGHSSFYILFYCWINIKLLLDITFQAVSPFLDAVQVHNMSHDFFFEVAGLTVESSTFLSRIVLIIYMVLFIGFCFYHAASKSVSTFFFVVPIFIRFIVSIFASAILVTGIRGHISSATTGSGISLKVLPKVLKAWLYNSKHSTMGYCDTNGNGIFNIFENGFGPFLLIIVQFIYYSRGYRSNISSLSRTLKHYLCYEYVYKMLLGPWFHIFCLIRLDDLRWGNRPGSVSQVVRKQRRTWAVIVRFVSVFVIGVNVALTFTAVADVGRAGVWAGVSAKLISQIQFFDTFAQMLMCLIGYLALVAVGNAFSWGYLPTSGLAYSLCDGISLDIKSTSTIKKHI